MESEVLSNKIIKTSIYLRKAKYFQLPGVRETVHLLSTEREVCQRCQIMKGSIRARQLRADDAVRRAAEIKHNKRIK